MNMDQQNPFVRVQYLSKSYVQRHPLTNAKFIVHAFDGVNLTINRGTTLALVGESGAGKSSLARCLALLERPAKGELWFDGLNLAAFGNNQLSVMRRQVQLIFQDSASSLNPRMTAAEIIAEPLVIQKEGTKAEQRQRALALMEEAGLPREWETKLPHEFSGGQRQRLAIARALTLRPKLLILDESLSNLDIASQDQILKLLSSLQKEHSLTYLHISHDLRFVSQFADEIAVMHEGKIIEQEPAAELFTQPKDAHTEELLAAMPTLETICAERFD